MSANKLSNGDIQYRCRARDLAPGSPVLLAHPKSLAVSEQLILPLISHEVRELFIGAARDDTIAALTESIDRRDAIRADDHGLATRLAAAKRRRKALSEAVAQGVQVEAILEPLNDAQSEIESLQAQIDSVPPPPPGMTPEEAVIAVDMIGEDIELLGRALTVEEPSLVNRFLKAINLAMVYDVHSRTLAGRVCPEIPAIMNPLHPGEGGTGGKERGGFTQLAGLQV